MFRYSEALPLLMSTLLKMSVEETTTILLTHKNRNIEEELFWCEAAKYFYIKKLDRFMHPDFVDDDTLHLSSLKKLKKIP